MRKLQKPDWMIFGEQCRERLGKMKGTKSGKREEQSIYHWWLEACEQHGYPGTKDDFQFLVGWLGRR